MKCGDSSLMLSGVTSQQLLFSLLLVFKSFQITSNILKQLLNFFCIETILCYILIRSRFRTSTENLFLINRFLDSSKQRTKLNTLNLLKGCKSIQVIITTRPALESYYKEFLKSLKNYTNVYLLSSIKMVVYILCFEFLKVFSLNKKKSY